MLRAFILTNAVNRHAESTIDVLCGEIKREVAWRRTECDCSALTLDPTDVAESPDFASTSEELSGALPDIAFVISSI